MELSEEEKKAIKILQEEHDMMVNPKLEAKYTSDEVKKALEIVLNLMQKQRNKIEDYKKFKKDIVDRVMIWDKEGLPKDEVVIRMLDTLVEEVSRLEDIEDKKVEVEISFIEEKRDKYWKEKIREKIEKAKEINWHIPKLVIEYFEELLKEA